MGDDYVLNFRIGDLVTRISHEHDILFRIINFEGDTVFLKGVDLRLIADSDISDLVKVSEYVAEDQKIIEKNVRDLNMDRSQYFYLPGKVLHIDGDNDYLERCMTFYKDMNIKANGLALSEMEMGNKIIGLLKEFDPDIVVITGHDAYYSKKNDMENLENYQKKINLKNKLTNINKNDILYKNLIKVCFLAIL